MSHPDPTARDLIQRLADSVELLLQIRNGLTPLVITEATLAEARVYLAQPEPLNLANYREDQEDLEDQF